MIEHFKISGTVRLETDKPKNVISEFDTTDTDIQENFRDKFNIIIRKYSDNFPNKGVGKAFLEAIESGDLDMQDILFMATQFFMRVMEESNMIDNEKTYEVSRLSE